MVSFFDYIYGYIDKKRVFYGFYHFICEYAFVSFNEKNELDFVNLRKSFVRSSNLY